MLPLCRRFVAILCVFPVLPLLVAKAQAPIALPYTMTTIAGTTPAATTAGQACPTLPAATATDAYGDGCPSTNAVLGAAGRGGVQVDGFGNVFVADDVNNVIHAIHPTSGIMTVLAGGGTACSTTAGKLDSSGDGCLAATQTVMNGTRGIGIDPYGNVLLAGYGDHLVHLVCRTASPLCTAAQVGYMELAAGCAAATGSSGTTGAGLDNTPGYSTNGNSVMAFNNRGTCSTSLGEVDSPRGAAADAYGNVYYADTASERTRVVLGPLTSSYFSGNNPLYAALGVYYASVTQGYVYTVANIVGTGTETATTKGNSCSVTTSGHTYSGTALDTLGDGCPFNIASVAQNTSYTIGVATDAGGDMLFTDPGNGLRVFYVGGTSAAAAKMAAAITATNPTVTTPQPGFLYMLAGNPNGTIVSATPTLGTSAKVSDTSITKLAVSPQGNIFLGDGSSPAKVLFFDINSGYIRVLLTSAIAQVAAGNACTAPAGQRSLSAYSDGCAASSSLFANANGLGVAADAQNNLYLYDSSGSSGMLVRKVLAQNFAPLTLGTTLVQNFEVHLPETASAAVTSPTAALTTTPDSTAATPACTQNEDESVDCNVVVTTKPAAPGLRSAGLTVSLQSGTYENPLANVALGGVVSGSALVVDSASSTLSGTTTAILPTTSTVFSAITPVGVATDGAGNVYAMDTMAGRIVEYVQGYGAGTLTSTLPGSPSQIAIDQLGDVFAVGSGTPTIEELAVSGPPASAGSPATFAAVSHVAYAACSGCTAAPQGIAVDSAGNLFVADKQSSTANTAVYRLSLTLNALQPQVTVATGFSNPVSLAVDNSGNVYVADDGANAVYKLTPGVIAGVPGYTQTTALSGVRPAAIAVDAAGNLYVQDQISASVIELPLKGPETTVLTGLQNPTGIAVDGMGDVYSADSSNKSVTEVIRDAVSYHFGSSILTTFAGTISNVGSTAAASVAQTDFTDFTVAGGASNGCMIASGVSSGQACTIQAALSPAAGGTPGSALADKATFVPAASTVGSLSFSGSVPFNPTTTTISGETPGTPLYSASGVEVTFTITIMGAPAGSSVSVSVDSGSATAYPLNGSNAATVSLSGLAPGNHTLAASYAGSSSVSPSSASTSFTIDQFVATGDTRTVTEPFLPAVCMQLTGAIASVNDDIPVSVDATVTNPDGARIQAALNSCAGTGKAVELSIDGAGHNAFLTGPLSMPSNVTLLVDPGVYVYFSRNVQDFDKVPGTHTCGNVSTASATSSCQPLIDIPGTSTNVGIMGFGKLDGRGGDTLINAIAPYQGQSWWGLSTIANSGGNQQNPRFVQIETGASNITLYKITLRNSPLFHISTTGAATGFTAWDIKIVTPTTSRNTDGIDPGNATNFTITRSWISDGDDNIAVGGAGTTAPSANISITNNHFFAGHGESIGSYTSSGVSNILFDSNMSSGNAVAGAGSAFDTSSDTNSTGLRLKSGYDRGGVVTNVQFSNSCYQDHKAEVVFSPNYEATTGAESPNFKNILMQNLAFRTEGSVQLTGTSNNGTVYPLGLTLDNVSFATIGTSDFSPAPTNASVTYGPGQVSSNFVNAYATFVGTNGNTVTNNITALTLAPPTCNFTYIAPELTGPSGLPQTITNGQNATAVVILTPAVGGAAYPTGSVTLTDALTGASSTVTLPGTTDTILVPLGVLAVGTHSFTATYSGDTNYTLTNGQTAYSTAGPYLVTVNAGSLSGTTTTFSNVPSSVAYGSSFTAIANVAGSAPTGTVQFVVGGGGATGSYVYATSAVSSGAASASINLPYSTTPYTLTAVYSGDSVNAGSSSAASSVNVTQGATATSLSANSASVQLGHPVLLTASVSSLAGTPSGSVSFAFSTSVGGSQTSLGSAALSNGSGSASATASVDLPVGTDYVTATYAANGSYAGSSSTAMIITVGPATIAGLPSGPIPLPYTISTVTGGSGLSIPSSGNMACAGATDKYGDGCQAAAVQLTTGDDLRAVVADPFGNIYFSDISATLVRRIAPNGVITDFAGRVTGTACVPTAIAGCTPTLVSISKPRGVGTDAAGNLYIADYSLNEVFKVSAANGLMYKVAGTGTAGSTGDGNAATSAEVNAPRGVWADSLGNIYIASTAANTIRVVDTSGNIHTFAGNGTSGSNGDGGPATSAEISNPQGVITDNNLNVYIADSSGGRIRVVCVTCGTGSPLDSLLASLGITAPVNGYIYTVAGSGLTSAYPYSAPVLSTSVSMSPQKLAFDSSGNLYLSDGNGFIWFLDFHTGFLRAVAANSSTLCAAKTDAYGDGCPATQASFGDGGNGIGVGADALGNIYISDTTNGLIRKVSTGLASSSIATGATVTQSVDLHYTANDGPAATNPLVYSSMEWALSAPSSCTTNKDNTQDCLISSAFTAAVPGQRSSPLTLNSAAGNTSIFALTGVGLGAGATLDPASRTSFGANLQVNGIATDNAGNVYVSDGMSKHLLRFGAIAQTQGMGATFTSFGSFIAPGAVAVDARGFAYVADTSAGTVTQISPAGVASMLSMKFTTPAGLAVDAVNNLYVSDSAAKAVYQIDPVTGAARPLAVETLVAPAGLAIDSSGNLLITDPGAPAIYRYNLATGGVATVSSPAVQPFAIAADAAGNLLIADTAAIDAVPASGNSAAFTVAAIAPSSLAIDSSGNLYTGAAGAVLKLTRTQGFYQFAAGAGAHTVTLLESGNVAAQIASVPQTDSSDYSLTAAASTDCTVNGTLPATVAIGGVCALIAAYTPTTFATTTDTATFHGNLANAALSTTGVELTLTGPAAPAQATVAFNAYSPLSPVYNQNVTVSVSLSGASITPAGTVAFTVDGTTTTSSTVSSGTASATLTGLAAGSHTISAAYTSSNGFAAATLAGPNVVVGQATATVSLGSLTQTYTGSPLSATATTTPAALNVGLTYNGSATAPTAAGSYIVVATINNSNYAGSATGTLLISKATPALAVASNVNPVLASNAVTLTATVSSSAGAPTGTVTFLSGSMTLGTGMLTGGVATLNTTALPAGSDAVTVTYAGDNNFAPAAGGSLTEIVETFTIAALNASDTVAPGAAAVFNFTVTPAGGATFPAAIAVSVGGLPAGATAVFSPATIAAGAGATNVTLTVQVPQTSAKSRTPVRLGQRWAPFTLSLLLLPFARRLRRAGKQLRRAVCLMLLLGAGLLATTGLSGCGSGSGNFAQSPQTYSLVVTGTSGNLSGSAKVTLTVE